MVAELRDFLHHQAMFLQFCSDLSIVVNWKKSNLIPSTRLQYLVMVIDTTIEQVFPSTVRLSWSRELATSFFQLHHPPAHLWWCLLDHMSSLEWFLPGGCTRMMKDHWSPVDGDPSCLIHLSRECVQAIRWWLEEDRWTRGILLHILSPSLSLYTDTSLSGWGAQLLDLTASGMWSDVEAQEHISVLEMQAVELVLASFLPQLVGQSVVLMSKNASVVVYLRHQGGTVSRRLCQMASAITVWAEQNSIRLEARYIPDKWNILVDQLSRPDQILPTEWSLLPRVFDRICQVFGRPHLNLFATKANNKLALYVSLVLDPLAWEQGTLHLRWNHLDAYTFPLFALLRQVITQVLESEVLEGLWLLLVAPLWPQKEWFVDLLDLLVTEPLELPRVWNLLVQSHIRKYHRGLEALRLYVWNLCSDSSKRLAFRRRL